MTTKPVHPSPAEALDRLAYELSEAKSAEAIARDHRVHIEDQITALLGVAADGQERTLTATSDDWKITVAAKLTRKVDQLAVDAMLADERLDPSVIANVFPLTRKLDLREFRAATERAESTGDSMLLRELSHSVTTKAAKLAVKVERIG